MNDKTQTLPPLPEPEGFADPSCGGFMAYTADQMCAFALQARAQVRGEPIGQVFYAADGGDDETGAGYYMEPCVHWFGKAPAADTKLYTDQDPSVPNLIEKAISSGCFDVLPVKATIPMCKAGWGASGGELTFQQIGHIYEEMYKARPLPDAAMLAAK